MRSWNRSTSQHITTAPLPFTGLGSYATGDLPERCKRLHKARRKVGIDVWKRASRIQLGINILDFLSDFGIYGHRRTAGLSELRACAVNDFPFKLCPARLNHFEND
jgi:hypothetical protein